MCMCMCMCMSDFCCPPPRRSLRPPTPPLVRRAAQSISLATVYSSVFFTDALVEALQDQLEKEDTLLITKFVWLMQKKTTVRAHENPNPNFDPNPDPNPAPAPAPNPAPTPNSGPLCGAAPTCIALTRWGSIASRT
jgi:hypothetical protein